MSRTTLVIGLLALAAVTAPTAHAECKLALVAEFRLDPSSPVPLVDGAINGAPVKILLDTGVTESRVVRSAATSLGVTMTPRAFSSGDNSTAVFDGLMRQLAIGDFKKSNVEMGVSNVPGAPPGVALVLGYDFLSRTDLELDLAHNAVRMFHAQDCAPPELIYWGAAYAQAALAPWSVDAPTAHAEATLDGAPVLADLDTGVALSSIDADAARLLGSPGPVGGTGRFASFALGDERVNDVRLHVAPMTGGAAAAVTANDLSKGVNGTPLMRIGADFFRAHRVFFDVADHLMLFSYAGGPVFAADTSPPK